MEEDGTVYAAIDSALASFGVAAGRAAAGVDGDGDGAAGSYSPEDLVAAVVDSGIDTGHRDLDGGKVIGWHDLVNGLPLPYDDHGHGTAVASVLAGEGDAREDRRYGGVAPGAALVGVKVLDSGGRGRASDVVAALQWVVGNRAAYGIEAVNLSVEQPGCGDGSDAVSLAAGAAVDTGLVVVAAAGNGGPGTCTIGSPGAAREALTVGAMADLGDGGFALASFSSRGLTRDGRIKPDVAAPGVAVVSATAGTQAGYAARSGTSLAAPFVTGLALLMRDADPALGAQAVKDAILAGAVDWGRGGDNTVPGSRGPDLDYGAGRLDGYAALEAAAGRDLGARPHVPPHLLVEGELAGDGDAVDVPLEVVDPSVPVAATLILPSLAGGQAPTPDFDLHLLGPDGAEVASATTGARQDELGHVPAGPGEYVLRVSSTAGSGGFFVDVSAGLAGAPPAAREPPAVLGETTVGETLVAFDGEWEGTPAPVLSRRWQRCEPAAPACADVPGATGPSYRLGPADAGASLRLLVTATNLFGAVTAASPRTAAVVAHPPAIVSLRARARGHTVVVSARTADCVPCRATLRIRFGGRWHAVPAVPAGGPDARPARPALGNRWLAVVRGVPSGRRPVALRVVDLRTGRAASERRVVRVR